MTECRGRKNWDGPEWVEHQQIRIAGNDGFGMPVNGEFKEFIVHWVAAGDNPFSDYDGFGVCEYPPHQIDVGWRGFPCDPGSPEDFEQLLFDGGGFQLAAVAVQPLDHMARPRSLLQGSTDEDVCVDDDSHSS